MLAGGLKHTYRHALALLSSLLLVGAADAQTCGAAHGRPALTAPTVGLCATGFASAVSGSGPYTWTCAIVSPATVVSCSAPPHCHDLDGNGVVHATTDGVILNRVMLGMTGTAVSSAAQSGSPRNTWPLIRSFLNNYCGYSLACVANGQTVSAGAQASINACITAVTPLAAQCCANALTIITYDNPIGSNSCVGTCGPPIGAPNPEAPTSSQ